DLAFVAYREQNYPEAELWLQNALATHRELGNRWGIADVLGLLSLVAYKTKNYSASKEFALEAVTICRNLNMPTLLASQLNNLGLPTAALGAYAEARGYFCESLVIAMKAGVMGYALESIVGIAYILGRMAQGQRAVELFAFALQHRFCTEDTRQLC